MLRRTLLTAGWLFPFVVLLFFVVKGQFYDPSVFTPPVSKRATLPVPATIGGWTLADGKALPSDRMYEEIDGKSDYYLQYGATELCSGEWSMNDQRWDMYLYSFKTEQGARGAFNGERPSDNAPINGMDGYSVPGQAAVTAGKYYLQLNALTANADPGPAVELAQALVAELGAAKDESKGKKKLDLTKLAGSEMSGESEGFIPENAFGFDVLNNVRTVDVSLNGDKAVWFTVAGDEKLVDAYAKELKTYGGDKLFKEDGASGGSMFGSWSIAGVLNGQVWGVQNATSHDALMKHWKTLKQRLKSASETP